MIDKEYIKMVDCPEIQDNLPEYKKGDWVQLKKKNGYETLAMVIGYHSNFRRIFVDKEYGEDCIYLDDEEWEIIRIPSLEDLWGMINPYNNDSSLITNLSDITTFMDEPSRWDGQSRDLDGYFHEFEDIKSLFVAYYMRCGYIYPPKQWNPDTQKWEEV